MIINDPTTKLRLGNVIETGTAQIVLPGRLNKCPDTSFAENLPAQPSPPSLVCEICQNQSTRDVENKAMRYLTNARGLDCRRLGHQDGVSHGHVGYCQPAGGRCCGCWHASMGAPERALYADHAADEEPRPAGQVALYLSDVLSPQQPVPLGLLPAYRCRVCCWHRPVCSLLILLLLPLNSIITDEIG